MADPRREAAWQLWTQVPEKERRWVLERLTMITLTGLEGEARERAVRRALEVLRG